MQLRGIPTAVRKYASQASRELTRAQSKIFNQSACVLVADKEPLVQCEERLDQILRHTSHTTRSIVDIPRICESAAKPQTELGAPQGLLNNAVSQGFRIF